MSSCCLVDPDTTSAALPAPLRRGSVEPGGPGRGSVVHGGLSDVGLRTPVGAGDVPMRGMVGAGDLLTHRSANRRVIRRDVV